VSVPGTPENVSFPFSDPGRNFRAGWAENSKFEIRNSKSQGRAGREFRIPNSEFKNSDRWVGGHVCYDEMMTIPRARTALSALFLTVAAACGGDTPSFFEVVPAPRRLVMWLDGDSLDLYTSALLHRMGVDEVVVRRGGVDLAGGAPVLRIDPPGVIEGSIPVGLVLEVHGAPPDNHRAVAEAVWKGVERELDGAIPAEIILDIRRLTPGLDDFITEMYKVSGVAIVPLLGFEQLQTVEGVRVAKAARSCIVPAFGTDGGDLRGIGELDPLPLDKKLARLAGTGVRVRLGISLRPRSEPPLEVLREDLNPLTEAQTTTVTTRSILDRSFDFEKPINWCGREWQPGERVAIRWMDASRLHAALREIQRLAVPDVAGWDYVSFPSEELGLGLTRQALLSYLQGDGPEPDVRVNVERSGRAMRVRLSNSSPFATAVSNYGNWLQVAVDAGWLVSEGRGSFDGVTLGSLRSGQWQEGNRGQVDAVRFDEIYLAPGEELVTGTVRLPSSGSRVSVMWRLTLFNGTEITGEVRNP
jgi:hypothetical protein